MAAACRTEDGRAAAGTDMVLICVQIMCLMADAVQAAITVPLLQPI